MLTLIYKHSCPEGAGCQVQGMEAQVRPPVEGSVYFHVPPRCIYTTAELELVQVLR